MDKDTIKNNFSRNAATYDNHAAVQKRCAESLVKLAGDRDPSSILEVGCGTGIYTGLLRSRYRKAEILACDISEDMINLARKKHKDANVKFKVIDGENFETDQRFDLITSNASFQWFRDFEGAFKNFYGMLAEGGTLCFSMYGPETFRELKEVLLAHFGRRMWLSSSAFRPRETIKSTAEKYFRNFEITEEYFTADFLSFWDFLRDIKQSGTRGEGLPPHIFVGKYRIREMEKTYIDKFGKISATHHVFFCKAHD